jgi:hypothetical protein
VDNSVDNWVKTLPTPQGMGLPLKLVLFSPTEKFFIFQYLKK